MRRDEASLELRPELLGEVVHDVEERQLPRRVAGRELGEVGRAEGGDGGRVSEAVLGNHPERVDFRLVGVAAEVVEALQVRMLRVHGPRGRRGCDARGDDAARRAARVGWTRDERKITRAGFSFSRGAWPRARAHARGSGGQGEDSSRWHGDIDVVRARAQDAGARGKKEMWEGVVSRRPPPLPAGRWAVPLSRTPDTQTTRPTPHFESIVKTPLSPHSSPGAPRPRPRPPCPRQDPPPTPSPPLSSAPPAPPSRRGPRPCRRLLAPARTAGRWQ